MSVHLTREERRELEDYVDSQTQFAHLAEELVIELIVRWIKARLPGLFRRIQDAAGDIWNLVRSWVG